MQINKTHFLKKIIKFFLIINFLFISTINAVWFNEQKIDRVLSKFYSKIETKYTSVEVRKKILDRVILKINIIKQKKSNPKMRELLDIINLKIKSKLSFYNSQIKSNFAIKKHSKTLVEIEIPDNGNNFIFNGIPLEEDSWWKDLVYKINSNTIWKRTIGPLWWIPLITIWDTSKAITIFNMSTHQESFSVDIKKVNNTIVITADGWKNIEILQHSWDYYDGIRAFALKMKKKWIYVKKAPDWAFDAIWETYGFEEDFDWDTIKQMLPTLKELGIKTITIDSGWYGTGRWEDSDFFTWDFKVNEDTVWSEEEFKELIDYLHDEGFKVRVWWVPGVSEKWTDFHKNHKNLFTKEVISSTQDTSDYYIQPDDEDTIKWNKNVVERFLSYGVDGFKQDDIYDYSSNNPDENKAYANLINNNFTLATSYKKDFVINTCNCWVAQNFYQISWQNQLITSDPVWSKQFRIRAKYLHALNINWAAILWDHVELTKWDVNSDELDEDWFYDSVDFTSIVPLWLVLETKFKEHPWDLYKKWFWIYNKYKFYSMDWINIPLYQWTLEQYLLKKENKLYFSFYTKESNKDYSWKITLNHLIPHKKYSIFDVRAQKNIHTFKTTSSSYTLQIKFNHSLIIEVK